MTLPLFRKSLLAFAIAASQPLLAETIQLSGQPVELSSRLHSGDLILQGQATGDAYAVALRPYPRTYFRSLVNQASLNASGDGSRTLTLDGFGVQYPMSVDITMGDLSNEGQINATGESASGIYLGDRALVLGNLNNSGTVVSNGADSAAIHLSNLSQVFSDLDNSGTISASGTGAAGIRLSKNANVWGILSNSGAIRVDGTSAKGIAVEVSTRVSLQNDDTGLIRAMGNNSRALSFESNHAYQPSYLRNSGSIQAEGTNSTAVYAINPFSLTRIDNEGRIEAQGSGSRAIYLGASPQPYNYVQSISNEGEIIADGIAIDIAESSDTAPEPQLRALVFQWGGLIEGSEAAIRGQGQVVLNLWGGEVRGNLIGLAEMYSGNDSLFTGRLIEARLLDVQSLELSQPHVQLDGNLMLSGGGNLDLNLHPNTDSTRPMLDVSGQTVLGWNSQIRLKPATEDFQGLPLRKFILLSADQIEDVGATEGYGLSVTSLSDLLQIRDYQITDTQITATVSSLTTDQVGDYLLAHGAQSHVLPAFTAFYGSVLGGLDEQDPLFQAMLASNDQNLVNLAQQLAPEVNGAAYRTLVDNQHLIASALQERSASLRHQPSFEPRETGAWVQVLNSDVDQGERSGIPGYDADSDGIAVGADGQLDPNTRLGVAYSYLTSDVRSQGGNKTDIQGHGLSLYVSYERDAWFVDAGVTYGRYDNEGKRHIAGTTAKGDYDSDVWGADLLGGYGLQLSQKVLLEPRVAARYSNVRIDSYNERGSAAALAVGSQRYEVGQLGAGIRLAGNLEAGQGRLEPEAILMAYHDFIADQVSSTSSFLAGGGTFVTEGTRPSRDSYQATLGMAYRLGSMKVGLGYDYLSGVDYSSDSLSGRVSYEF
ncbi:autotransporter domain-containing protein [Pseudomonas sp. BN102]|uniref:autotransporter family protein n=1 Tax=Pseudomonas sp. BN102 TaxID=2567886 RepID=UPI002454D356|nr:autotransporter domain-containing protein [Pseudomonas sp. BN102]